MTVPTILFKRVSNDITKVTVSDPSGQKKWRKKKMCESIKHRQEACLQLLLFRVFTKAPVLFCFVCFLLVSTYVFPLLATAAAAETFCMLSLVMSLAVEDEWCFPRLRDKENARDVGKIRGG